MMKLNLDKKYNNKVLATNNNIIFIYGQNTLGKSYFLNHLKSLIVNKKTINLFSDLAFDDNRELIEINEEWDLKKELSLAKTSPVRKFIVRDLLKQLEKSNIDLLSEFRTNDSLKIIKNHMNKIVNVEESEYFIEAAYKFKTDSDLIDQLFLLNVVDKNGDEIIDALIPKSIKFQLFIKLLLAVNSKQKIILLDCPEAHLDSFYQKKLVKLLQTLADENLLIITYRTVGLINKISSLIDDFYFLDANLIVKKLFINDHFLTIFYLLKNQNFYFYKFKTLSEFTKKIDEVNFIINKKELKRIKQSLLNYLIPFFLNAVDFKTKTLRLDFVFFLTENEQLVLLILALINDITFEVIKFKNPLLAKIFEFLK